MRHFYEQVKVEESSLRFYAGCPICGRRRYAARLPLLCRDKSKLRQFADGTVGGTKQMCYNHSMASAVQRLARYFNRCTVCGSWVCDDCFDLSDGYGACPNCAEKAKRENRMCPC